MREQLYLNTYRKEAAAVALAQGVGIEFDEFLLYNSSYKRSKQETIRRIAQMRINAEGIEKRIVHGTVVSTDLEAICSAQYSDVKVLYETSYLAAEQLNAHKIVFHCDFIPGRTMAAEWLKSNVAFWKGFLAGKQKGITVCLENFVDDSPSHMAALCDAVDDPRFRLCLDMGHAHANSNVYVGEWIAELGTRIDHVHLHNNDGSWDLHWPLGRGTLDMDRALRLLRDTVPAATITIEADFEPSLKWLEEHGWI